MKTLKLKNSKTVNVSLEGGNESSVVVIACDAGGKRLWQGDLIIFNNDGTIFLPSSVDANFGFQLDENERIKVSNNG